MAAHAGADATGSRYVPVCGHGRVDPAFIVVRGRPVHLIQNVPTGQLGRSIDVPVPFCVRVEVVIPGRSLRQTFGAVDEARVGDELGSITFLYDHLTGLRVVRIARMVLG